LSATIIFFHKNQKEIMVPILLCTLVFFLLTIFHIFL
jgi:hypothetical protein